MAKERLSKLQKWILTKCYTKTKGKKCYTGKRYEIWRSDILSFFGEKKGLYTGTPYLRYLSVNEKNKAEVSITNSLKNLFKKGYIDLSVGHLGGWYSLEESEEAMRDARLDLRKVEETGKPLLSKLTGKEYDAKYLKQRIMEIEEEVEEGILRDTLMGHNIHRLKLTDKGIELAKSLNIN